MRNASQRPNIARDLLHRDGTGTAMAMATTNDVTLPPGVAEAIRRGVEAAPPPTDLQVAVMRVVFVPDDEEAEQ